MIEQDTSYKGRRRTKSLGCRKAPGCIARGHRFATVLLAIILVGPVSAQVQNGGAVTGSANPYAECQRLLDSPPLNTLGELTAEGRGAMIRVTQLGAELIGRRCSRTQVVTYMQEHGFVLEGEELLDEPMQLGSQGSFNRRLTFCAASHVWWARRWQPCSIIAIVRDLDDVITFISAGAGK